MKEIKLLLDTITYQSEVQNKNENKKLDVLTTMWVNQESPTLLVSVEIGPNIFQASLALSLKGKDVNLSPNNSVITYIANRN